MGSRSARRYCVCDNGRVPRSRKPGSREGPRCPAASPDFRGLFGPQYAPAGRIRGRATAPLAGGRGPRRSCAYRHHLRRHRARTGDRDRAWRAAGDWASVRNTGTYIGHGSTPNLSPVWVSPARQSSTASCLRRPEAATRVKVRRTCLRPSSPASAITAAKD